MKETAFDPAAHTAESKEVCSEAAERWTTMTEGAGRTGAMLRSMARGHKPGR